MFTFSQNIVKRVLASICTLSLLYVHNGSYADVLTSQARGISSARVEVQPIADYDLSTVLVQFNTKLSQTARDTIVARFDGAVLRTFRLVPGLAEVRVGTTVGDALSVLRASKDVIAAEPNYRFQLADVPNDPNFTNQWALDSTSAVHIDVARAWGLRKGTHGLKIAVLDTGIDKTHPEFSDNVWTNPNEIAGDGIDNDGNGYIDDTNGWDFSFSGPGTVRSNGDDNPADGNGHGTHVSGIIAAQGNNSIGMTGICWDAAIVPLKVVGDDGSGFTSWMIAALEYCAQNGITVANASIGGARYSGFCKAAIDAAGAQGNVLVVAAAGNNGTDNDVTPFYPASYDCPNIISVASTTSTGAISSFSNRGVTSVDIAAPGSSINSTYPKAKSTSGYTTLSGTSMAAPMVTAVAALLRENRPEWGNADIKSTILSTVTRLNSLQGKVSSGGLVNAFSALTLSNQVDLVGLRLNRDVLRGGDVVNAEVTVDRVAAAGGATVQLTSSNPAITFPASVQISGGTSTIIVTGTVASVGATTIGDVTATVQGRSLVVPVTVKPPMLASAQVDLPVIARGGRTQGLVSLQMPAGVGGMDVIITSDDLGVVVPASVHIDAGKTEGRFDISISAACLPGDYQIKASTDADCVCVDVSVLTADLSTFGFTSSVVVSGQEMFLRLGLSAPAPPGGLIAQLTSSDNGVFVPNDVAFGAGKTQVDVRMNSPSVSSIRQVSVTAGYYGTARVAAVTIVPCTLSALVPDVTDLASGISTSVVVRLTGPAGPGGIDVHLSDAAGKLSIPSLVHIVEGESAALVVIHAQTVSVRTSTVLVASDGMTEVSVPFTLSPVGIASLSLSATTITGGSGATGTITLSAPAPGSGADVYISSGSAAARVPASVHIPAGANTASFAIASSPVRAKTIVVLTVTAGMVPMSKSLTVNPAVVSSVKLAQASMTGGATQQATVNLSGPAPDGGLVVALSSTNAALRLPASVTIPAGKTSSVFTIQSVPVAIKSSGLVVAQLWGLKKLSSLSVNPPVISAIVSSRASIVGGDVVDVTVQLTGDAPVGGTVVVLTSANVALSIPANVTVPAGQKAVVFSASSHAVVKSVSVKVSGRVGLATKSGYVGITPR